jgi:3-isopropylmalate/(R)-2-methylmalate dehydratase small subunit
VVVPQTVADQLLLDAERAGSLTVDLERQEITRPNGQVVEFEIQPSRKQALLEGLDEIALTLKRTGSIDAFEDRQRGEKPWQWGG